MQVPLFQGSRTTRDHGAVVFIISAEYLVDHLKQIFIIRMGAERCRIICLETVFEHLFDAKGTEEFLYHKESAVGGKFASVKINYKLFIAFEVDIL